jgi:integrase/recombinase XerD
MGKRGVYTPKVPVGDLRDPNGFAAYLQRYLAWLRERNYAETTVDGREIRLRGFITWCEERSLKQPQNITKPIIERYQRYLFLYRKPDGKPLSAGSQHTRLTAIKCLFQWLARQNYILYNPASDIELPRVGKKLPKSMLNVKEIEQVLAMPDLETPMGIRDRAMLETLYSTGIRRMELLHLQCFDVDADRGVVMIRQGKGKKDRVVPIGERALEWIAKYMEDVRPELSTGVDHVTLFLSNVGEAFSPRRLTQVVRDYVEAAHLGKIGSCHLFRHTMATLMLENGADIRFIQAILGHADLSTTQIYTQVSIRALKEIHTATHPGRPIQTGNTGQPDTEAEASLLAALEEEREEE